MKDGGIEGRRSLVLTRGVEHVGTIRGERGDVIDSGDDTENTMKLFIETDTRTKGLLDIGMKGTWEGEGAIAVEDPGASGGSGDEEDVVVPDDEAIHGIAGLLMPHGSFAEGIGDDDDGEGVGVVVDPSFLDEVFSEEKDVLLTIVGGMLTHVRE